jgi:hypothetical protein
MHYPGCLLQQGKSSTFELLAIVVAAFGAFAQRLKDGSTLLFTSSSLTTTAR